MRSPCLCLLTLMLIAPGCEGCEGGENPLAKLAPISRPDMASGQTLPAAEELTVYCPPGTRRCLSEQGPQYERCDATGQQWERRACAPGQMCRGGQCAPFSCVPGRPLCVGPKTQAVCNETGRQVIGVNTCTGDEVCRGGQCVDRCDQAQRRGSYIGCEYVAYKLANYYEFSNDTPASPYAIVVANPDEFDPASVSVTDTLGQPIALKGDVELRPGASFQFGTPTTIGSAILGPRDTTSLGAGLAKDVLIPPRSAGVLLPEDAHGRGPFHIHTTQPTVAYQFSPYCCNFTATNDASLLLPRQKLGRRYRIAGYPTWSIEQAHYAPYITLIAPQDTPLTTVTVSAPVPLVREAEYRFFTPLLGERMHTFSMRAGEATTLSIGAPQPQDPKDRDLSGTLVESSADITVFSGHPCTFIPSGKAACDHLESQIPPASTLGTSYLLPSIRSRNPVTQSPPTEGIYWRITADEDAILAFDPPLEAATLLPPSTPSTPSCRALRDQEGSGDELRLRAGQSCEVGLEEVAGLTSSGPLILAGYLSGHHSTGIETFGKSMGDPAMFVMPPVLQFREDYAFVTPPTFKKTYFAIAIPKGTPLLHNGAFVKDEEKIEPQEVTLEAFRWEVFQVAVTPGVHTVSAARRFGLLVYAYDDYVSYAFPGGLNLQPRIKE